MKPYYITETSFQELYLPRLYEAGFRRAEHYPANYYKKDNIVIQVYIDTIFVERVNKFPPPAEDQVISLISTQQCFIKYKYWNIPADIVVNYLCGDLQKIEMNVENYMLERALAVL